MSDSSKVFLTTKELADLLRLKERKIYELAASGEVPCSRATGKLLFPRREIEAWISKHSSGFDISATTTRPDVFLGSHDPLLEWALRESGCGLAMYFDGSEDGLQRFVDGEGVASALHLYDETTEDWNVARVRGTLETTPVTLIEFAWRERGFIVPPENPLCIEATASLVGRRVAGRQAGAGSQLLLELLMHRDGVEAPAFSVVARSESDAALAVLEGAADVAFGLRGLAEQYRLGFVPVMKERVDLLVDRRSWFEPPLQSLARFCRSPIFEKKAKDLKGYDVSQFGAVHYNSPT